MRFLRKYLLALLVVTIASCGGDQSSPSDPGTRLLAQAGTGELRIFEGVRARYGIYPSLYGYSVTDLTNGGRFILEVPPGTRLRFADMSVYADVDGAAGQAYRLYKAAFNRTPDANGISFWIEKMEQGVTAQQIAEAFVQSDEFRAVYGSSPTSAQLVDRFYQNILGRSGEPAGRDFWQGVLDRGAATLPQVLAGFSESRENKAGVLAAIQAGVPYLEPGVAYLPTANAGPNRIADLGRLVTLDGGLSTVSIGKRATYSWSITSRPTGSAAVLLQPATAEPSFVPDQLGTYELQLTVSDGTSTSEVSKVSVVALWRPADGVIPASGNVVYLESQYGDYVGGGATLLYTAVNSLVKVNATGAVLTVELTSDSNWTGHFAGKNSQTTLERGYYADLKRWPFHDATKGGLDWSGAGRGCNSETGWFVVDSVTYDGLVLTDIDLRFEQHCEGGAPALHGRIRWSASDHTPVPVPVIPPVPTELWQPRQGATPQFGNYVYLESEQGDYIGQGKTYLYTGANAKLTVDAMDAVVRIGVKGDEGWNGAFAVMYPLTTLRPGFYDNVTQGPLVNPLKAGLSWSGEGRGCGLTNAWFTVDRATYFNGRLTELDLRFELRCQGSAGRLHGKVHWSEADNSTPPGPVNPPPSGLWQPPAGATPVSGNYAYFENLAAGGRTYLYTASNSTLSVTAFDAHAQFKITGDMVWQGDMVGMESLTQLQVGYYGDLQRYPFNNPLKGGISWSIGSSGCNKVAGWFVVDKVSYAQGRLTALDVRFEHRCEGFMPPLYGKIHWSAN